MTTRAARLSAQRQRRGTPVVPRLLAVPAVVGIVMSAPVMVSGAVALETPEPSATPTSSASAEPVAGDPGATLAAATTPATDAASGTEAVATDVAVEGTTSQEPEVPEPAATPLTLIADEEVLSPDEEITLRLRGWVSQDGGELAAPSFTVNVLDPSTGEVTDSYPLSWTLTVPASGSVGLCLPVSWFLDSSRLVSQSTGKIPTSGTFSLTLSNGEGQTATTGAFVVASLSTDPSTEPSPEPSAPSTSTPRPPEALTAGTIRSDTVRDTVTGKERPVVAGQAIDAASEQLVLSVSDWTLAGGNSLIPGGTITIDMRFTGANGASVVIPILMPVAKDGSIPTYGLPLWPFSKGWDKVAGDYTLQWRPHGAGDDAWRDAGTYTLSFTLPRPGAGATLSGTGSGIRGTGWVFNTTTSTGKVPGAGDASDTYGVALQVRNAAGAGTPLTVFPVFDQGSFTISHDVLRQAMKDKDLKPGTYSVQVDGRTESFTVDLPQEDPKPVPTPVPTPSAPFVPVRPTPAPVKPAPQGPTSPQRRPDGESAALGSRGRDKREVAIIPGEQVSPVQESPTAIPSQEVRPVASQVLPGTGAASPRPSGEPSSPVTDVSELSASNAGSLSGSRQGGVVTLILPQAKAKPGDWVSVFLYPGATTTGWTQVDAANSVSVDVSSLWAGTYQLAVADRDNHLLGWAQLEVSDDAAQSPTSTALMGAAVTGAGLLGPGDWMLVSAGGLLMLGAASFIVLAKPGSARSRH